MHVPTRLESFLRRLFLITFNGGAVRKAATHQLFSREFCLGCLAWACLSGLVVLQSAARMALPEWLMAPTAILAVFTGCCWVIFPIFVSAIGSFNNIAEKTIRPGKGFRYLTGNLLWQQALQGKLSFQFFGALLLESVFIWMARRELIQAPAWQFIFGLACFINTLFYLVLPFLLFLGQWFHRGINKAPFQKQV